MKEDNLLNDLFESARTEEPKRSFEEVADSFTKTVPPTGISETVRELLLNNISLNSVLVVVTSGALLTAVLMMSSPSEAVSNDEIFSQIIPQEKTPSTSTEKNKIVKAEAPTKPVEKENNTSTNKIKPKEDECKSVVITKDIPSTSSDINIENISPESKTTPSQKVTTKGSNSKITQTTNSKPQQPQPPSNPPAANAPLSNLPTGQAGNINAINGYNELFTGYGTNLKKLKRNLLNKLINDGFIETKKDEVIINIEEREVVINGIKLKPYLYTKYTSIVQDHEIVPEENRQIRINDNVILVGDFTKDGFKGKGEGHGDQLYLPDFQKDIELGNIPIDISQSTVTKKKSKISFDQHIMQEIFEIPQFEAIFRTDSQGEFLPITILTNNRFSSNLSLHYKNQPIKLIHGEASLSANAGLPIIYMDKYRFGKKKGTIKFLYDGYEIIVQLKQSNNDWVKSRFQVKGKKENRIDVKF